MGTGNALEVEKGCSVDVVCHIQAHQYTVPDRIRLTCCTVHHTTLPGAEPSSDCIAEGVDPRPVLPLRLQRQRDARLDLGHRGLLRTAQRLADQLVAVRDGELDPCGEIERAGTHTVRAILSQQTTHLNAKTCYWYLGPSSRPNRLDRLSELNSSADRAYGAQAENGVTSLL